MIAIVLLLILFRGTQGSNRSTTTTGSPGQQAKFDQVIDKIAPRMENAPETVTQAE